MKVQINKDVLTASLDKMYIVSTKSLIPNFNHVQKVTIEVKDSGRAVLTSSNGCLIVQEEVETQQVADKGICTTDSVRLRNAVKKIVTNESTDPIELYDDNGTLFIRDAKSKQRKIVKLPIDSTHHNTKVVTVPDGDSFVVEPTFFLNGFRSVAPFQSKGAYQSKYQTVLMHWIKNEMRMVCGDGALFAIYSAPRSTKDSTKKEFKRTIVLSQLLVIAMILEEATDDIEFIWKDKTTLWISCGKIEMLARGLPDIDYINYECNAYRTEEAKAYVDIERKHLKEVSDLLVTLQDKERAERGQTHSCFMKVPSSPGHVQFDIRKTQGKFQCEYEVPATYYDLGGQTSFECCYAHLFFESPAQVMRHPHLRLYLLDETGTGVVNAYDAELGDVNRDGIPQIKDESEQLRFFFARLREVDEEDGEE